MGVYIKGMEMPKSCGHCKFKYLTMEGDECMFDVAYTTYQSRPKDCPLVPVPPHGRLIDVDALPTYDKPIGKMMMFGGAYVYTQTAIDNAPTIIPASEEET